MHVFPIEIYRCTLGADSCSQSGRSPELAKVAGEPGSSLHQGQWPGMSGPRTPLEASTGNEYFVHGVQGRKVDQLLCHATSHFQWATPEKFFFLLEQSIDAGDAGVWGHGCFHLAAPLSSG